MWKKILLFFGLYKLPFCKKSWPELKQASFFLLKKYNLNKENFKFTSKKSFIILIPKSFKLKRKQLLEDIIKYEDFEFEGKGQSSLGRIKYKNKIIIYIKPKEMQGGMSPGKDNEIFFHQKIENYISSSDFNLDINFKSVSSSLFCEGINYIYNSSNEETKRYHKSDIQLINDDKVFNLSLKKEGGFIWESTIKRHQDIYNKFLFKAKTEQIPNLKLIENEKLPGKYLMINTQNGKPYGRIVIKGFPFYNDEDIIFGSEIPKTVIIENTFKNQDFIYDNKLLTINVKTIYKTVDEVKKDDKLPVLSFSRNMSKPYGIELKCIPEDKTLFTKRANILELDYNFLMES